MSDPNLPQVIKEDGMSPNYVKVRHPDGREQVFDLNGKEVIEGEVAS